MKKTVFCLLCLILLLPLPVRAAKGYGMIRLSAEKTDVERGEEFTLAVDLPRNPGVKILRLKVEYSPKQLELKLAEDEKLLQGGLFAQTYDENADFFLLYWSAPEDSSAVGRLARLHFRVKDTAPVGVCSVAITASEWDCVDAAGEKLRFDLPTLYLNIPCHHTALNEEILTPVSFAEAGQARITCADCGESWEEALLPSVKSRDGKAVAVVTPGEFTNETAEPTFSVQSFFAGSDYTRPKEAFGERFYRAFRLKFTSEGQPFTPKEPVEVHLEAPEAGLELYALRGDAFEAVNAAEEHGAFIFSYENTLFVYARAEEAPPVVTDPPVTEPPVTEPVPVSSVPEEETGPSSDRWILYGAIALFGFSAVALALLLYSRRRNI